MDEREWLAEEFERERPHMRAVAYRMLGSVSEADDAIQESWLRLARSDSAAVDNLGGWLTTVVSRVCLDMLRARRSREERFDGSSLPEPVISTDPADDPAQHALMAESVGLALLVVLDNLTPAERLAFVMHDMFAVPFGDIAEILDSTPAAARQLASRARRRVRGAAPDADSDLETRREVVDAFLAAARSGDFEALVAVLHPDVVFRVDTGGGPLRARPAITGAQNVAREILTRGAPFAPRAKPALVNGSAGFIVTVRGRTFAAAGFAVTDGRITEIDIVADPEKLQGPRGDQAGGRRSRS